MKDWVFKCSIVKCGHGSGGAASSAAVTSWQSPGGGSGGKGLEKIGFFYIWRANK